MKNIGLFIILLLLTVPSFGNTMQKIQVQVNWAEFMHKQDVTILQDSTYRIDLRKGEVVKIYAKGSHPDFVIRPIANKENNCFGKKKQ